MTKVPKGQPEGKGTLEANQAEETKPQKASNARLRGKEARSQQDCYQQSEKAADETELTIETDQSRSTLVPITEVVGSNGIRIKCSYMKHPAFDATSNLCLSIHYAIVKLAPHRHSGWSTTLFTAIKYFLDFLHQYNSAHPNTNGVSHIRELTPSVFKSFTLYLNKIGKNQVNAFKLKSLFTLAAKETDIIPLLELPPVTVRAIPSERLYEDGLVSLRKATTTIVDLIRKKIKNRIAIDQAEPYTLEELNSMRFPRRSDAALFAWYKYRHEKKLIIKIAVLREKIEKAIDPEIRALANSKNIKDSFHALYERVKADIEIPKEYHTLGKSAGKSEYYQLVLDPHRVVKTFIVYDFPFFYDKDELANHYNYASTGAASYCVDAIQLIHNLLYKVRNYQISKGIPHSLSIDEHLSLYYPTAVDAAGIALLMMLQAGWNKETVMDIDKDNHVHGLTGIVENGIKIVWSEKYRSQSLLKPYDAPKRMFAQTNSSDPYSLYSLIQLSKELTAPIAHCTFGKMDKIKNRPVNSMFSFVRPRMAWVSAGPVGTLDHDQTFSLSVAKLLKEYVVTDNGVRLTNAKSLTRRIRTTWMFYNSEKTPFAFLSQLLGHESRDTTDKHYDSSPAASSRRFERLREALEEVISLLRSRNFKGILGETQQTAAVLSLSVFHLPFLDRALWACKDRTRPDWKGAPILAAGALCGELDKCIFCGQLWVLKDSLPYLVERLKHIEDQFRDHSYSTLSSNLVDEQRAIETILNSWPDQNDVKEAVRYRALNSPLLPREMRDLKLIFRSSSLEA